MLADVGIHDAANTDSNAPFARLVTRSLLTVAGIPAEGMNWTERSTGTALKIAVSRQLKSMERSTEPLVRSALLHF